MTIKKFLVSLIFILSAASFLAAQDKKSPSDQYTEQLRIEQENAKNQKQAEAFAAARQTALFPGANLFLPVEKDSWAISVTANGGIMGGSRLIGAVNSDGNFLCSSSGAEFKINLVDKTIFDQIAQAAKSDFPLLRGGTNIKLQPNSYCSDCAFETLNIVVRRAKKPVIFQFDLREIAAKPELTRIYEKISNLSDCR